MRRLSEAAGRLLRKIGHGRQRGSADGGLMLRYRQAGGDGLILSAWLNEEPVRLWLDEAQWCRWVEPVLPVPDWPAVPPVLHAMLSAWTLAGADACLAPDDMAWPRGQGLVQAHVAPAPDWCLCLERHGARLDIRLLDLPLEWIDRLAACLQPVEAGTIADRPVPVALVAGWARVAATGLRRLECGDALLLGRAYRIADGEIGLFADAPLACLCVDEAGHYRVGGGMGETENWVEAVPTPDDVMLTVVAELGTLQVPLVTLGSLRPGDVLDGAACMDAQVTLKIAGQAIARGMLLDIGGRLAVRIEQLG